MEKFEVLETVKKNVTVNEVVQMRIDDFFDKFSLESISELHKKACKMACGSNKEKVSPNERKNFISLGCELKRLLFVLKCVSNE
jgi:hypothetical protein